ncbi:hypothetical protein FQP90_13335 [Paenarthrobacter nitroguajacolicus]|uniref:Uncharacterized protein n=1 Tax=Paenarthrobacter nitroguajacolicus TaxID=211146 RepID=A0A558GYX0_PAENT|nr:hypothetical protein [Paenarthrobacter nitroguajacolicus]TVU62035.1 hypothetical protein FQP90_13335 [Paenarthrobacter nitroguajacolicus]
MTSPTKVFQAAEKATDEELATWPNRDLKIARAFAGEVATVAHRMHEDSTKALAVSRRIGEALDRRMFGSEEQ